MNQLINPEGAFLRFITKLVYSVWLNILWFICCIPIITIGPATTALFACCQKLVADEDGYVTAEFFRVFRANFKQATVIGLILTLIGIALGFDSYVLYHLHSSSVFWTLLTAVFIVACIAYAFLVSWIFPLLARFDNTTPAMFKNALLLSIRYLLCSIFILVIDFIMILIVVRFFTPAIIFGYGTCAFFHALLMRRIFISLEPQEADE